MNSWSVWEYKIASVRSLSDRFPVSTDREIELLDRLGESGWEAVDIRRIPAHTTDVSVNETEVIFKRPKIPSAMAVDVDDQTAALINFVGAEQVYMSRPPGSCQGLSELLDAVHQLSNKFRPRVVEAMGEGQFISFIQSLKRLNEISQEENPCLKEKCRLPHAKNQ